jgi:hypothetical protein
MAPSARTFVVVVAVLLFGASLSGCRGGTPASDAPSRPRTFVAAKLHRNGRADLQLVATDTRRVIRTLARDFALLSGNNVVRSSDGRQAVFSHYEGQGVTRVDIGSGQRTEYGGGFAPALSSDGTQLAFLAQSGVKSLVVLDIASGAQRSVDLAPILPPNYAVAIGRGIAWLDNTRIAVVVNRQPIPVVGGCCKPNVELPVVDPSPRLVVFDSTTPTPTNTVVVHGTSRNEWSFVSRGAKPNTVVVFSARRARTPQPGALMSYDLTQSHKPPAVILKLAAGDTPLSLDSSDTFVLYLHQYDLHSATIYNSRPSKDHTIAGRYVAASF